MDWQSKAVVRIRNYFGYSSIRFSPTTAKLFSLIVFFTSIALLLPLSPTLASTNVIPGTFDCELSLPNQRTDSFLIACADGNTELYKIHWKSWNLKGAFGYGQYAYNDCHPYCAAGHVHFFNVAVQLSKLRYFNGKPYLTYLTWWETGKKGAKLSRGRKGGWDLYLNFVTMGGKI